MLVASAILFILSAILLVVVMLDEIQIEGRTGSNLVLGSVLVFTMIFSMVVFIRTLSVEAEETVIEQDLISAPALNVELVSKFICTCTVPVENIPVEK